MRSMRIDDYSYGHIVIDGREERRDVIITRSGVHANWWRKEGHALHLEDLTPVLEETPEVLLVGTGTDGNMRPAPGLVESLKEKGIEVEVLSTFDAVRRFNELLGIREAAAALHLTC
jgi:hypothetical protein